MAEFDRVIDYIIEQANRYDINNLQFEEDIKFQLRKQTDKYMSDMVACAKVNITSVLIMQNLMINISRVADIYISNCKKILLDTFAYYYDKAYDNTGDLIDLGNEISAKFSQGVNEQKSNKEYDSETIGYIQQHAFELLTGHTKEDVERIRARLGDLFLKNKANKVNVRNAIESVLGVSRSKAEEIAQTELSRAYNRGFVARMKDYGSISGKNPKKYWHGFKYSQNTCEYCRSRIGNIYDLDDESETLPAHPRCRCIWLPIFDDWDMKIDTRLISRANMLNTGYNKDMIYLRINNRLGINYAEYLNDQAALDYMSGDRSEKVEDELSRARDRYIKDKADSFDIAKETANTHMSKEFNQQIDFWKKYVAGAMADNNRDVLDKSYQAIQGVMLLPWTGEQLSKWNQLLGEISKFN